MKLDCRELAKKCDKCQCFTPSTKARPKEFTTMTSPWLFSFWRIDLIGQLPKRKRGAQHAGVAVDYFIK